MERSKKKSSGTKKNIFALGSLLTYKSAGGGGGRGGCCEKKAFREQKKKKKHESPVYKKRVHRRRGWCVGSLKEKRNSSRGTTIKKCSAEEKAPSSLRLVADGATLGDNVSGGKVSHRKGEGRCLQKRPRNRNSRAIRVSSTNRGDSPKFIGKEIPFRPKAYGALLRQNP